LDDIWRIGVLVCWFIGITWIKICIYMHRQPHTDTYTDKHTYRNTHIYSVRTSGDTFGLSPSFSCSMHPFLSVMWTKDAHLLSQFESTRYQHSVGGVSMVVMCVIMVLVWCLYGVYMIMCCIIWYGTVWWVMRMGDMHDRARPGLCNERVQCPPTPHASRRIALLKHIYMHITYLFSRLFWPYLDSARVCTMCVCVCN